MDQSIKMGKKWSWCWNRREQKRLLASFSVMNGAQILEELVTSFNGESLPMRVYSFTELSKATNGFDEGRLIERDDSGLWRLYRGIHDGRAFSVKKFNCWGTEDYGRGKIITEVAIASQMGKDNNFLKLVGYCVESELPILVYEDFNGGLLSRYIYADGCKGGDALRFETRLKIANDIANAVSFLHHGTCRTVVHADIRPATVFLDDGSWTAKLGDLVLSLLIPLGEDHVIEAPLGTLRFVAPEVSIHGRYTEKSDVYSFGVTLLEILCGKRIYHMEGYQLFGDYDFDFIARAMEISQGDIPEEANQQQVEDCTKLIERCLRINPEERPTMIEAAQAIRKIRRLPA